MRTELTLSEEGEKLIKSFEGLRLEPYQDSKGKWTIGWGHTEGISEKTPPCTESQAEKWFWYDIDNVEFTISELLRTEIHQCEFDALCSFVFNLGAMHFQTSTLLRKLNLGDRQGAGKEFLKWVYYKDPETAKPTVSKGLQERRQKEMELFLRDLTHSKNSVKV